MRRTDVADEAGIVSTNRVELPRYGFFFEITLDSGSRTPVQNVVAMIRGYLYAFIVAS